jgi:hypothetical protein
MSHPTRTKRKRNCVTHEGRDGRDKALVRWKRHKGPPRNAKNLFTLLNTDLIALIGANLALPSLRSMACLCKSVTTLRNSYRLRRPWLMQELSLVPLAEREVVYDEVFVLQGLRLCENGKLPKWVHDLPSLKTVVFSPAYTESLRAGQLPQGVQSLTMGYFHNNKFDMHALPPQLKCLIMGTHFNKSFEKDVLPKHLQSLQMGSSFNQPIGTHVLPKRLQRLNLGCNFHQRLQPFVFAGHLKSLTLGYKYNLLFEKNVLPDGLCSLTLGKSYNKPFGDGILPRHLESLVVGRDFNQRFFPDQLPKGLCQLVLGYMYNQPFGKDVLPRTLTSLTVDHCFDQPLEASELPVGLRQLHIQCGGYFLLDSFQLTLSDITPSGPIGVHVLLPLLRSARNCQSHVGEAQLLMNQLSHRLPVPLEVVTLRGTTLLVGFAHQHQSDYDPAVEYHVVKPKHLAC